MSWLADGLIYLEEYRQATEPFHHGFLHHNFNIIYPNLIKQHNYKDISIVNLPQQKLIALWNTGIKLEQKAFIITIQLQAKYH